MTAVSLHNPPVPSVMRKLFCVGILLMIGAATMPQLVTGQSYYLSEWQPKTFGGFPGYVDIDPPTGAPTVVLSIDFNDTLAIVPELIYGNNAVGWQKRSDDNPTRVRHYRNANLSILRFPGGNWSNRSEEHTSELQSRGHLVCRLLLEKTKKLIT